MTDIISNEKKTADRFTVPIKIEMNDDTSNIKVDINSENKSREMTKKHFTKQTSRPSSPQQTVTHNEQQERTEAKIINIEIFFMFQFHNLFAECGRHTGGL